jgi:ABC-2 type transport system permease protein
VKHLLLLLKVQILGFFGINRLFHGGKARVKNFFIGSGILLLGLLFAAYSVTIALSFAVMGMVKTIPALMIFICAMVSFFTVFWKSSSVLFGFRDYELLMSLPVKKNVIIQSRLCALYALEFIFALVILFPAMVVYGVFEGAALPVWVMIFLSPLIVPLLPMTAGTILGSLLSLVSLRFRHRNMVTVIVGMAAVVAVMAWSFSLNNTGNAELISLAAGLEQRINRMYPPALLFAGAIAGGRILYFFLFILLSIIPPALFTAVLTKWYGSINSAMAAAVKGRGVSRRDSSRGIHIHRPFYALYIRELRRFIAFPVYVLNTAAGAVLLIAAAVSLWFTGAASFETGMGAPGLLSQSSFAIPFFPAIFTALSPGTASSISLEGKTRWVPSSRPVKTGAFFAAKIALNLSVFLPAILIAAPLLARSLSLTDLPRFFIFVTPAAYACFTSVAGLAINVRFPKYDWTTEQQAIKQSASVMLTMLAGFPAVFIPLMLTLALPQYGAYILGAATLLAAAAAVLLFFAISRKRYYGFT